MKQNSSSETYAKYGVGVNPTSFWFNSNTSNVWDYPRLKLKSFWKRFSNYLSSSWFSFTGYIKIDALFSLKQGP